MHQTIETGGRKTAARLASPHFFGELRGSKGTAAVKRAMLSLRFGMALCAAALMLPSSLAAAPRAMTWEDTRAVVGASAPQISPDGTKIVYVRSRVDYAGDRMRTELVLIDVASGISRVLTHDRISVGAPRWTLDGTRVSYLSPPERAKPPQLYVLRMDGGDSERMTNAPNGVDGYAWRPDGKAVVYSTADDLPNKKAIEKHDDAVQITDEHFLTREQTAPRHLWLVDGNGRNPKRLTSGTWSVAIFGASRISWTPDGTKIFYQHAPDAIDAHWVHEVTMVRDVASGEEHPLVTSGMDSDALVSRDGKVVAIDIPRHGSPYLTRDFFLRGFPDGHDIASTVSMDRNIHWGDFAPDGSLMVGTTDGVREVLWKMPPGGPAQKIDLGDVDFAPDATIANTGAIAFVGHHRKRPSEIYLMAPGGAPRRLTDDNAATAALNYGDSVAVDFQTDDGMHADGVLTYPPDYVPGKKYPLVLEIHGGPVSTSHWNFSAFTEMLAAPGRLVFQPNYRGSDNLGDAFLNAIVGHVTSGPGRDNMAGLAAVIKLGIVDESRIGVSGWSGGGLQTSWLVGHSKVFKAAVSGAAVNDWYEQAVLADINEEFAQAFIPGASPFTKDGRAAYNAESPITFSRNISTPLLILSDTGDQRVPITQSYALYHALADRGATVKFIAFPRSGHFPTDPVGREIVNRAWAGWFDQWLK